MILVGGSPVQHLSLGKSRSIHRTYSKYFEHIAVGWIAIILHYLVPR